MTSTQQEIREKFLKEFACTCLRKCGEFSPDKNYPKEVADWWLVEIEAAEQKTWNKRCEVDYKEGFLAGQKATLEQVKSKIGMLRQWLNEDRITDKKMVTNEEIEIMLSLQTLEDNLNK